MSCASQRWPWIVLGVLLAACLAHGLWVVRDLGLYTAILDTYRDAGFVQGLLDGNFTGDPSIDGALRYYPPMMHVLAAAVAWTTHAQPLQLLVRAAPWVNLLIPATFFLMVRRLIDAPAAAIATVVFVCFNGMLLPPWMTASYSPWHCVPALTQALFFCGVWLISARASYGRFIDAVGVGSFIGIVFLAHTVPALILAAIAAAAALSVQGARLRTAGWVATAAFTAALWAAPFLIPLISSYHLKILNAAGAYTDPLFDPTRLPKRVILASLPGLGALGLLGWNLRGSRRQLGLPGSSIAILGTWTGLPLLFMARHFGCGGGGTSAVCAAFPVPVHHWMMYLQSALACVFGFAVASVVIRRDDQRAPLAPGAGPAAPGEHTGAPIAANPLTWGAILLACALLFMQPTDGPMRQRAMEMRDRIDLRLYQWLLSNTRPGALFVTDVSTNAVHDSAAMAVLAAGRKSVALPFTYSNPYVDWREREERGESYLAASRSAGNTQALCRLLSEAGAGNPAYVALRSGTALPPGQLQLAFRSNQNDLYAVTPSDGCR